MSSGSVSTFEDSLDRLEVGWTHTSPSELAAVLREVCTDPVVGVELSSETTPLPSWVNTNPTPAELRAANTGITGVGLAIADYGSVVVQSTPAGTEPVSLFGDRHVAVLHESDIVPGMPEAFEWFGEEFRTGHDSAIIATGPSATADMGALVTGAHGPKDVHVVILDE
ncbi:LUD domain-containing protein [Haloferax sp. DFSO52]|uniref:LUD domain-containing protein n=1 Tax=Haloferax sp. DFSO52 TaxID=3388505 RepID=UPI003A8BBB5D